MHSEHRICLDGLWGNRKVDSSFHTLLEFTAPSMTSCVLWLLRLNDFFPSFLYLCLHSRQFLTATQHTTNKQKKSERLILEIIENTRCCTRSECNWWSMIAIYFFLWCNIVSFSLPNNTLGQCFSFPLIHIYGRKQWWAHQVWGTDASGHLRTCSSLLQSQQSLGSLRRPRHQQEPWDGRGNWWLFLKTCPVLLQCCPTPSGTIKISS